MPDCLLYFHFTWDCMAKIIPPPSLQRNEQVHSRKSYWEVSWSSELPHKCKHYSVECLSLISSKNRKWSRKTYIVFLLQFSFIQLGTFFFSNMFRTLWEPEIYSGFLENDQFNPSCSDSAGRPLRNHFLIGNTSWRLISLDMIGKLWHFSQMPVLLKICVLLPRYLEAVFLWKLLEDQKCIRNYGLNPMCSLLRRNPIELNGTDFQ